MVPGYPKRPVLPLPLQGFTWSGAGGRPRDEAGEWGVGVVSCTHTTCISSHPTHIFLSSLPPPSQPPSVPRRMDTPQPGLLGLDLCGPTSHARGAHAHSSHAAPHTTSPRLLERGSPHHPNLQAFLLSLQSPWHLLSLLLLQTSLKVPNTVGWGSGAGRQKLLQDH